MNRYILFFAAFFLFLSTSYAQSSWQWATRGGSVADVNGYGPDEDINDITTDKWGNVYAVSVVEAYDITIGSLPVTIPASSTHVGDICITSYTCDGTLRWFKMIVASQANEGIAIKTDTLGGVYVVGRLTVTSGMTPNKGYILNNTATDTTLLPFTSNRSMFLLKLDTGGAYKWFRMPEPDTFTIASPLSWFYDMDVDEGGNIYTLCRLSPGAYADYSFVATDTAGWHYTSNNQGEYILEYDRNGNFVNGMHLPFRFAGPVGDVFISFIKRDNKRHRFYISGGCAGYSYSDTISVAGTSTTCMFVACFDDAGTLLWLRHDAPHTGFGYPSTRPAIDKYGNIYVTGSCSDSFAIDGMAPFINQLDTLDDVSFLAKLDTNGNEVWASSSSNSGGVSGGVGVATFEDTVAVFGYESCLGFAWGSDTIGGTYLRPYLARFNLNTGATISIDTIDHDAGSICKPGEGGGYLYGTTGTLATDIFGNFYCGGDFNSEIYIASDTIASSGGYSEWFMAKFGTANCSVPILSVANHVPTQNINIYPNPATSNIIVENAETGSRVKLFNMTGQCVYAGIITSTKQAIDIKYVVPGSYILQVTRANGNSTSKIIEKQ